MNTHGGWGPLNLQVSAGSFVGRSVRNKLRGGISNGSKKQRSARTGKSKPAPDPDPAGMANRFEDPPVNAQGDAEGSPAAEPTPAATGSELSALLKGKGNSQPEVQEEQPAPALGVEKDKDKRDRDHDALEKAALKADGPADKKPKRAAVNSEGVRGIVREENGFLMSETESKLRAMVRDEFKLVREELMAALGVTEPNATLKGALAEVYTAAARALIEEALQKLRSSGPFSSSSVAAQPPVGNNWADIGRLSVIEGTLTTLEVLCKTRADSDSLREARNILMDINGVVEGLKVTGTNLDHKTDALRSMLASLPISQPHNLVQPFMQPPFAGPWNPQFPPQFSLGLQGDQNGPQQPRNPLPGAPNSTSEPQNPLAPPQAGPSQIPRPQAGAAGKKPDDSLSVAIRAAVDKSSGRLVLKDGLPKNVEGLKAVLRGLGFPEIALEPPDKYFVIKPKLGDTIRTFKAIFPDNPYKRAGFLRVANSEHIAQG